MRIYQALCALDYSTKTGYWSSFTNHSANKCVGACLWCVDTGHVQTPKRWQNSSAAQLCKWQLQGTVCMHWVFGPQESKGFIRGGKTWVWTHVIPGNTFRCSTETSQCCTVYILCLQGLSDLNNCVPATLNVQHIQFKGLSIYVLVSAESCKTHFWGASAFTTVELRCEKWNS